MVKDSQKLWEGDGTSEPGSDIRTRSPTQLTGITYLPLSRVWVSVPSGRPHPHPDATSPSRDGAGREAGAPHGNAQPWPERRTEQPPNPHPALATAGLRVTRASNQAHKSLLRAAHSFLPRHRVGAIPPHLPQLASVAGLGAQPWKHNPVCA